MKKNLALTGMMGVGKSTIGRILSRKLNMKFADIDKIIKKRKDLFGLNNVVVFSPEEEGITKGTSLFRRSYFDKIFSIRILLHVFLSPKLAE